MTNNEKIYKMVILWNEIIEDLPHHTIDTKFGIAKSWYSDGSISYTVHHKGANFHGLTDPSFNKYVEAQVWLIDQLLGRSTAILDAHKAKFSPEQLAGWSERISEVVNN